MQGAAKQQVNAEEMLAELKQALEASAPPSIPPPPSRSVTSRSGSSRPAPQIDKAGNLRIEPKSSSFVKSGKAAGLQKGVALFVRNARWAAGGAALAGLVLIGAIFVLVNKNPNSPKPEASFVAAEAPVKPQIPAETPKPSSGASPAAPENPAPEPSRSSASEALPGAGAASPATGSALPVQGEASAVAPPQFGALGLESTPPALPEAAKDAAAPAAPQTPKPEARPAAPAPPTSASTDSARPNETPTPPARPTGAASLSAEPEGPAKPKIDPAKKPLGKPPHEKPAKSAKILARPAAQTEQPSPRPASVEAQSPPQPLQETNSPAPAAAPAAPWIGQRFADGMTHGLSYLAHLPGAILPHAPDPNSGANPTGSR